MLDFRSIGRRPGNALWAGLCLLLASGCDRFRGEEPAIPTEAEAAQFYSNSPDIESVAIRGNLVEVRVAQPEQQLRRGGSLWARVGPYVYLFSPGTRDLFQAFPGVAAVRVVTTVRGDREVARAMLRRDELSDILWRRSLNILGLALQEGTERPSRLEELVHWGEEHTEYEYDPAYVPSARNGGE